MNSKASQFYSRVEKSIWYLGRAVGRAADNEDVHADNEMEPSEVRTGTGNMENECDVHRNSNRSGYKGMAENSRSKNTPRCGERTHCGLLMSRASDRRCRMTQEDALLYIKILSRHFGVPTPRLRWSRRATRGYYRTRLGALVLGPRVWCSPEAALVHEFAHHLTAIQNGPRLHHETQFCEQLERVVRFFYATTSEYPWTTEYQCVGNYAKRVGLLKT